MLTGSLVTLSQLAQAGLLTVLSAVLPTECKITTEEYCHLKGCVYQAYVACETPRPEQGWE